MDKIYYFKRIIRIILTKEEKKSYDTIRIHGVIPWYKVKFYPVIVLQRDTIPLKQVSFFLRTALENINKIGLFYTKILIHPGILNLQCFTKHLGEVYRISNRYIARVCVRKSIMQIKTFPWETVLRFPRVIFIRPGNELFHRFPVYRGQILKI